MDPLGANTSSHSSSMPGGKTETGESRDTKVDALDSVPTTPKSQTSLDLTISSAHSTPSHDRPDIEFDAEMSGKISNLSHEELLHLFKRQAKTLNRYKTRFSEVCFCIVMIACSRLLVNFCNHHFSIIWLYLSLHISN